MFKCTGLGKSQSNDNGIYKYQVNITTAKEINPGKYNQGLNYKETSRMNPESIFGKISDKKNYSQKRKVHTCNEKKEAIKRKMRSKFCFDNIKDVNSYLKTSKKNFEVTPDTLLGCYANLTKMGMSIDDYFVILSRINGNKRSKESRGIMIDQDSEKIVGSRPKLYWARHLATGFPVVIKVVSKTRIYSSFSGDHSIWNKLCLKLLNLPYHPNVMRIYQILEDDEYFYLVMEGLEGGELFQFLITEQAIPEETCKYIIRQILESVNHLHCSKILHRDVKPENIMFRYKRKEENASSPKSSLSISTDGSYIGNRDPQENEKESGITHLSLKTSREYFEVVLVDFDTCEIVEEISHIQMVRMKKRLVGTFGYLAPEVLSGGEYSTASDLWSIGIILYILMTGIPPLRIDLMCDYSKAMEVLKVVNDQGGFQFDAPPLPEFPLAQDLCIRLLQWDPKKRLQSCQQALKHPWLIDSFKYNPVGPIYKRAFTDTKSESTTTKSGIEKKTETEEVRKK
ncbi:protein kinase domain [Cryptosporidium ryanae]|uniref:protein kinase domain n=1 Tax=Cryptosporidium ryanae TaxID=515981 RepID=UPI00351AA116|nr:protein kinase domain [Cryptosporidium ryanae]